MLRTDVLFMSDVTAVTARAVPRSRELGGTDGCEHARRDLAAAGQLQGMMLPARVNAGGWNATYR